MLSEMGEWLRGLQQSVNGCLQSASSAGVFVSACNVFGGCQTVRIRYV